MHWPAVLVSVLVPATLALVRTATAKESIVEHEYETTREADQAVRDYWTPERIKAIDHDPYATTPLPPIPAEDLANGTEYTGGGAVRHAVGRLFYTDPNEFGAVTDSSCTATLVQSRNKATIVTAAHCMKYSNYNAAPNHTEHTQWNYNHLFVPGYRDDVPMTNFTLNRAYLESDWVQGLALNDSFLYDRAYAVLNPDPTSGKAAGDVISSESFQIGFGLNETSYNGIYDFGYPRSAVDHDVYRTGSPAFTGRRLAYCTGKAVTWWRYPSILVGEPCQMSGGCSGGPTFVEFDSKQGTGKVVAVNSLIDTSSANRTAATLNLYSSSITDTFSEAMYNRAQEAKPVWHD